MGNSHSIMNQERSRYIRKILLFLVPVVLGYLVLELGLRSIPNNYTYKKNYLDQNVKDLEVLAFGSSHSYRGIDPSFISRKAFNAAAVAQTINYDHFIFDKYKDQLESLKVLVLPISYQSLFSKLEDHPEKWRIKNYVLYFDHLGYPFSLLHRSELFGKPRKGISQLKRLVEYYVRGKDPITVGSLGFEGRKKGKKDLEKTGLAAAQRHTLDPEQLIDFNIELLQQMIDHCKERNIKVLLLTFPGYRSYTQHLDPHQVEVMQKAINNLVGKNPEVRYENLLLDKRFVAPDFADGDHLSITGAEKLSRILNDWIEELIQKN